MMDSDLIEELHSKNDNYLSTWSSQLPGLNEDALLKCAWCHCKKTPNKFSIVLHIQKGSKLANTPL